MLVDANGNNLTNLTGSSNANDMFPSFSPDGTQVVFSSNADGGFDLDLYTLAVPEDQSAQQPNASREHIHREITRVAAAVQSAQSGFARLAPVGSFAFSMNRPIEIDVKSPGEEWGGHAFQLVRLGRAQFHLSALSRLTVSLAGVLIRLTMWTMMFMLLSSMREANCLAWGELSALCHVYGPESVERHRKL